MDDEPSGYDISGEVTEFIQEFARQSCEPLAVPEILKLLSTLSALTIRRAGDDTSSKVAIAGYAERIFEYPADVVKYVLKNAADNYKFFPAWQELKEDLEFWGRSRVRLRDAILQADANGDL